ncbi:MAG: phosphate acyltransferase PlsX [Bacteroidetes bacterium]|nr:phosphate acyltransferase PlsX [Bacteroidota bacterium]
MESPKKFRIALDAMGGDYAPQREVAGALDALRTFGSTVDIVLVGDENILRNELQKQGGDHFNVEVVHAPEVITMNDSPTAALKQKKNSSLAVGMRLHREGNVDAFVSAGNTGAVLSAATLILGRIKGVSRPTIGTFIPAQNGVCLLLDAGANVDCRAQHLYEFAVMGSIYVQHLYYKKNPTVGLLNVGEEKTKGTQEVLKAYEMLSESSLNFVGNIEGRDIFTVKADVVVCDGFVGNALLKFGESFPSFLKYRLREYASRGLLNKLLVGLALIPLKRSLNDLDPNEHGGVPVLGVNGVVVVGHGSTSPKGFKNMILRASEVVRNNVNHHIEKALHSALFTAERRKD